jgi:hypothetical protein
LLSSVRSCPSAAICFRRIGREASRYQPDDFVSRCLRDRARADRIPKPYYGDPVGVLKDELEIVADADHRLALIAQIAKDAADVSGFPNAECGRWLI